MDQSKALDKDVQQETAAMSLHHIQLTFLTL